MDNIGQNDGQWMLHAIELAKQAEACGEVPVGALIVRDDEILAEAFNQPIAHSDPTAHAEINALRAAAKKIKNYRIVGDATLYTTLEPCVMCAGAIVHARISRVVFGAYDPRAGSAGSVFSLLDNDKLNHKVEVRGGVCEAACAELLQVFFRVRRSTKVNRI